MAPTKAVILAAGTGSRLATTYAEPKPLVQVLGRPLAARTCQALREAGLTELGVVIGYRGSEVRAVFAEQAAQTGLAVQFLENPRWSEPNGISLRAAEPFTGADEFVLSMVDHIFDAAIVRELCSLAPWPGVTLAVDDNIARIFDLDDATKVVVDEAGHIEAIGKELARYNAIDCGLFRCTPAVFPALDEAFAAGSYSISGGMQVLGRRKLLRAHAVHDLYWQDVDTPAMLREAERWLAEQR